jgi:hypothetical protein
MFGACCQPALKVLAPLAANVIAKQKQLDPWSLSNSTTEGIVHTGLSTVSCQVTNTARSIGTHLLPRVKSTTDPGMKKECQVHAYAPMPVYSSIFLWSAVTRFTALWLEQCDFCNIVSLLIHHVAVACIPPVDLYP